jgi:hypothetical protein
MKKFFLALAAVVSLIAGANVASANGCPGGPFCQQPGPRLPFFRQTPVPAFQAAPWYLYFPYNGHFQTPAPMMGGFTPPPAGAGMMNPYFPAGGVPMQMPAK